MIDELAATQNPEVDKTEAEPVLWLRNWANEKVVA